MHIVECLEKTVLHLQLLANCTLYMRHSNILPFGMGRKCLLKQFTDTPLALSAAKALYGVHTVLRAIMKARSLCFLPMVALLHLNTFTHHLSDVYLRMVFLLWSVFGVPLLFGERASLGLWHLISSLFHPI